MSRIERSCAEIKKLFSPYLDGRVNGTEMGVLTRHLERCADCEREYAAMQRTQQLLAGLGPKKAPADLALTLYSAPSLEQSAFGTTLGNIGDDAVVVEAYVDANGRVEDYRIVSRPADAQAVLPQLRNLLIFTTFRPALSMGRPTTGTAILSFSKISVRG